MRDSDQNIETRVDIYECIRKSGFHTDNIDLSLGTKVEKWKVKIIQFSSGQLLSSVRDSVTPLTAAHKSSLPITNSRSLLKFMSIEFVMQSNHLILCCPLLLLPPIFPSIRVFFNESVWYIRWPKYWGFSFSISPSNEYSGLISFKINWYDLTVQ